MSLSYLLPSTGGSTGPILQANKIVITTVELIAGYTSQLLNGLPVFMQISVNDNNATWTLDPKVFRFFWDVNIANNVNMKVPNTYTQDFKQYFTPDGVTGGPAGAIYENTNDSFFTIQANPNLIGVSVEIIYCYWDI
jgi:hypothetical protein